MKCARHPQVETYVRCSKCDKAICPDCMISTPVGYRCRDCAGIRALPMSNLRPILLVQAVGAAIGLVFGAGLIWAIVFQTWFLMLLAVAGMGVGFLVAEGISRAASRRSSPVILPILGGLSAGLSILAGKIMSYMFFTPVPFDFAVRHAFDLGLWGILSGALAVGMAVTRLRM